MMEVKNQEHIKQALAYYFIMKNGIAFRDFFMPRAWRPEYKTRYYQYPFCLFDEAVIIGGRSMGKSLELEGEIMKNAINEEKTEAVLTTFRRMHTKDRLEHVIEYIYNEPYLREFFKGNPSKSLREAVNRTPVYTLEFKNGHVVFGISTGDDPAGINIQGKHPCIHPDQRVSLSTGKNLYIKQIIANVKRGEKIHVKSYDLKTKKIVNRQVLDGWYSNIGDDKIYRVILEDNSNCLMTGNHRAYVEKDGKVVLKKIKELKSGEDFILTTQPELSKVQFSLAMGSLLGDACLQRETFYRNGKRKDVNKKQGWIKNASYRVVFRHASAHADYVQFKYEIMKNFSSPLGVKIKKQHPSSWGHEVAVFNTRCLVEFDRLAELFYKNKKKDEEGRGNKKRVSKEILNLVDEKALAVWFMDDGSSHISKGGVLRWIFLHTEGYSYEENILIKRWFKRKFGIQVKVAKSKKYFLIFFNRVNGLKLLNLILPFLHPLFLYKVANIEIDGFKIGSRIKEFFEGDKCLLAKRVVKVMEGRQINRVCDISVKDTHNYFAGGMLVSNCFRYVDESQVYTKESWDKFQSAEDPRGAKDKMVGTVDGRRESTLWKMEHEVEKFKGKCFHIPRLVEPFWTQKTKRNLSFREDSEEYKHQILSNWGEPTWGLWNERDLSNCFDQAQDKLGNLKNRLTSFTVSGKLHYDLSPNQVLIGLPEIPKNCDVILGIDTGYTSPTVILPFFFQDKRWNLTFYIQLVEKIIPELQAEYIDFIVDKYRARAVGIDCSSSEGKAPATVLANPKNKQYVDKEYDKRLFWVEFQKSVVVGYKEGKEIKERVKDKTTQILVALFANKIFNIYYDEELLAQFCAERQKRSAAGNLIIDTPANVHIPEAFRCFAYVYYQQFLIPERMQEKTKYEMMFPSFGNTKVRILGRGGEDETNVV